MFTKLPVVVADRFAGKLFLNSTAAVAGEKTGNSSTGIFIFYLMHHNLQ
ncbi:MAG: hypothetical protein ABUT20_43115 [Bacteroidota bacterium]